MHRPSWTIEIDRRNRKSQRRGRTDYDFLDIPGISIEPKVSVERKGLVTASGRHAILDVVDFLEKSESDTLDNELKRRVTNFVHAVIKEIDSAWEEVCAGYAEMSADVLGKTRLGKSLK